MLVRPPQPPNHLVGLQNASGLTSPAVLWRKHVPEMLRAAERGGPVLRAQTEDLPAPPGIDAENRRWKTVRADHEIADLKVSDRAEPIWSEHVAEQRLRPTPHKCQRRDLDRAP